MYADCFKNVTRHPQPYSWQFQLCETEALADRLIRIQTGREIAEPIGVAWWQTRLVHSLAILRAADVEASRLVTPDFACEG